MKKLTLFVFLFIVILIIFSCGDPERKNPVDPENPRNKGVLEKPATITVNATAEQGGIRLTWAAVPKAIRYNVYRSEKKDGDYKWVGKSEKNEYFDTTVEKKKDYFYKVTAVYDVSGNDSDLEGSKKRAGVGKAMSFGPLSKIEISEPSEPLIAGSSYKFSAKGFDEDKNELVIQPNWSLEEGVGTITDEGVFTTKKASEVTIAAKVGDIVCRRVVQVGSNEAKRLKIFSGDGQEGTVSSVLPKPLIVLATDDWDNPVSGTSIDFKIEQQPEGSEAANLSSNKTKTNTEGQASATLTMGRKLGKYTVKVTFSGRDTPAVTFEAMATRPDKPAKIIKRPPEDTLSLSPGAEQSLEVTILDQYDNPVEDATVSFKPSDGASVSPTSDTTDENGKADTILSAWTKVGDYKIDVSANGLATFFSVKVETKIGNEIIMNRAPPIPSSGTVGAPLSLPIKVKVTDKYDNPVKSVPISFTLSQYPPENPGKLSVSSTETNANGISSTELTLGAKIGKYVVQATSPKVKNAVEFPIEAKHGPAEKLLKFSGDGQTEQVTYPLSSPLVVEVLDIYKNPVSGHKVQFKITQLPNPDAKGQKLSNDVVFTGTDGKASVQFIFGDKKGNYQVTASAQKTDGAPLAGSPVIFSNLIAEPIPEPDSVIYVSGDEQTGTVGTSLNKPFVVQVLDKYQNPIENVKVDFQVITTSASASISDAFTNSDGEASSFLTLGTKSGEYTALAKTGSLPGVTFTAEASPDKPDKLSIISGDGQVEYILTTLPAPLTVEVTDKYGNLIPEISVKFEITSHPKDASGSNVSPSQAHTNDNGQVQARLMLGNKAGDYEVTASLIDFPVKTVKFTTTAKRRPRKVIITVTNARTGMGIAGATVVLGSETEETDSNSEAIFEDFPNSGKTPLHISKDGYIPKPSIVDIPEAGIKLRVFIKPIPNKVTTLQDVAMPFSEPSHIAISADNSRAYVTNYQGNNVSVINTFDNKISDIIDVGDKPMGVAVNPVEDELYVANSFEHTVSVIDARSNKEIKKIPVGKNPTGITVSTTGDFLFVANKLSNNVSVVDLKENREVATIPVGKEPVGIAILPNGNFLYVSNAGGNTISVVDLRLKQEVNVINVGSKPEGIAASSSGKYVYVAISGSGSLLVIETTTNTIIKTFDVGIFPRGVTVDGSYDDGDLVYVTIHSSSTVTLIDIPTGAAAKEAIPVDALPIGIAITQNGERIYVANSGSDSVSALEFER